MQFEQFVSLISQICSHTPLAGGRPLYWTIIANPKAGGFTIKSRWKKHYAMLLASSQKADKNPLREGSGPSDTAIKEGGETGAAGLVFTRAAGHAGELTEALLNEAARRNAGASTQTRPFYLIITAGGDGTSLEVMTALLNAAEEIRRDFIILRLPMGTGNDGADARELDKALDLLIEPAEPVRQRAVLLKTASGKGPFPAFNILSVGLDAFVTHMTNKMKGKMPGDSYKLWIDVAALFYDRIYNVDYMDVRSFNAEGKEVMAFREKLLLLAMGESGRRTYGSNKKILPDERNVCALKQMPLLRKLTLKAQFYSGTHPDKKEAMLWNASSVEISGRHPVLAQMDGEAVLLDEGDFPVVIELSEPVIPILRGKGTNT